MSYLDGTARCIVGGGEWAYFRQSIVGSWILYLFLVFQLQDREIEKQSRNKVKEKFLAKRLKRGRDVIRVKLVHQSTKHTG